MARARAFYVRDLEPWLRLGDVIRGVTALEQGVKRLRQGNGDDHLSIEVVRPKFSVVLSPCCSIEQGVVCLSPLLELRASMFENPYFAEDPTRVNRLVTPDKQVPPERWEKIPDHVRAERMLAGPTYTMTSVFVYAGSKALPHYVVKSKAIEVRTNHYMVDFQRMHKVNCVEVQRGQGLAAGTKVLQLSVLARQELRDKLGTYYSRVPQEDLRTLGV